MKKHFNNYFIGWASLLILFNIIAFVSVGWADTPKYTASFWIGYVFITMSFFGQLFCAFTAFKEENLTKVFYNIPIVTLSYSSLIVSFVIGGLCMLVSPLPYWVGAIVCAITLVASVLSIVKAKAAADIVSDIDKKVKVKTFFIKSLTVDAETLMARAKSDIAKEECRKVYEAVRYSDPMSDDALSGVESEITLRFNALSAAVADGDDDGVKLLANEVVILIGDRNRKCKVIK